MHKLLLGRPGIWFVYLLVYGALPLWISNHIYSLLAGAVAPKPAFWLILALAPVACVLPGFLLRSFGRHVFTEFAFYSGGKRALDNR